MRATDAPFSAVLFSCRSLLVVSDLHLGARTFPDTEARFLRLLDATAQLTDAAVVNGDLFDFWFGWPEAVPPAGRTVLPALEQLAQSRPVLVVGGNHDRWGDGGWATTRGLHFAPWEATLDVAGQRVVCRHGDGLGPAPLRARLTHAAVRSALVQGVVGALPPALGYALVHRLGPSLDAAPRAPEQLAEEDGRQRAGVEAWLEDHGGVDWLLVGHTHRAGLGRTASGARWLNSGAFAFDGSYAILNRDGAELCRQP